MGIKALATSLAAWHEADSSKERVWNTAVFCFIGVMVWLARDLRWEVLWEAWPLVLKGLGVSWLLALISIALGMLAAVPLALLRVYGPPGLRHAAVAVIEVVRATPELMVVFWIFFIVPTLTGRDLSAWASAVVALSLIAAAYLAEVVRAGLYSVPDSQYEASLATGMTRRQTFVHIILPQATRNMVPAFLSQFVMLFKTTSLVYVIGVVEFFRSIILVNNALYAPYALYATMAMGYFVSCYVLSRIVKKLDPSYVLVD